MNMLINVSQSMYFFYNYKTFDLLTIINYS